MSEEQKQGEFEFKAEVQRVLSLVINSLYQHPEVFLRELISNSSDALDKARFLQLSDNEAREQHGEPGIDITLDNDNHTLTIEDNGVGLTREEMVESLGTIAHSGTAEFLERYAEAAKSKDKDALELIGQFGVGFYSVFMVAQRVEVHSLSMTPGSEAALWRSSGEGTFHVLPDEREHPGTRIVLHLKEDAAEFDERWRVEAIIKKYSDFVMFPIRIAGEVVNQASALWRLPKSQVTEEQHAELFQHITGGRLGEQPRMTVHYAVDAPVQFSALLYVPERQPSDLFQQPGEQRPGPRLYAKRVMIMENCDSLLPVYLRFIRGVVDSEDLSLNVSRETLQENRTVKQIATQLTKQVLKGLAALADEDADRYAEVWKAFGQVLKEGVSIDFKNKDAIADLCRFESLERTEGALMSLAQYLDNKTEEQKSIYYITGTSREQAARSPHLEVFRKKGYDVLLLTDPIDEWVVQSLPSYRDVPLESVVHGKLDLGEEPEQDEAEKTRLEKALAAIKGALGDRVSQVRSSARLTDTACCLVSAEGDPGANLERLMKMLDERANERARILEVNPTHSFVKNLALVVERDPTSERIALWAEMLYDQALLSEGVVKDPAALVKRIQDLLVESSGNVVDKG